MLLSEVGYAQPDTLEQALEVLAQHEGARALAGGQTLINVMKARAASPDVLVDLNRISALKGIDLDADGTLEIGPMTTYSELIASPEARARPILGEVCAQIADVQVRNRGTIGGNICSSDPTNHLPPLMVSIGAQMTIAGADGERTVAADEFFLGVYMTAVAPEELLTKITIPAGRSDGFAAIPIGKDGTCIVNAAATANGELRVALGCVGAVPELVTAGLGGRGCGARGRARGRDRAARRRARVVRLPPPPGRGRRGPRCRAGVREGGRVVAAVETTKTITVEINGETFEREVDSRRLLIHFIRDDVDLTGSHIGCDTGNCGACSVILDGTLVKSCMLLAVQADGCSIETVEGLSEPGELNELQQAFNDQHALQCGYCTPGMLMSATALLRENSSPSDEEISRAIQGNICRCTGYWNIVKAIRAASGQEV